jgi:hypothetical protein
LREPDVFCSPCLLFILFDLIERDWIVSHCLAEVLHGFGVAIRAIEFAYTGGREIQGSDWKGLIGC